MRREDLMKELRYDPETGVWTRLSRGRRSRTGEVGCICPTYRYRMIWVGRNLRRSARLAWLYMTGEWPGPGFTVDHINLDRADDRWANLRLATRSQQQGNKPVQRNNFLGVKGVSPLGSRFVARFNRKHLGVFDTIEEAGMAYKLAAESHFGEYART